MHKINFKATGAAALAVVMCLSAGRTGYAAWTTEESIVSSNVILELGDGPEISIKEASVELFGSAYVLDGAEDSNDSEIVETSEEAEEGSDSVEDGDTSETVAAQDTEVDSDETEAMDDSESAGTSKETEEDSDSGEDSGTEEYGTTQNEAVDSDGEMSDDGISSEDSDDAYAEAADDEDGDGEEDTVDAGEDTKVSDDSEETDEPETSAASVLPLEQVFTEASAAEEDSESEGSADPETIELDSDDIEGLCPDFPEIALDGGEASAVYTVVVENGGSASAVLDMIDFEPVSDGADVDVPDIEEGYVLEPGETLELEWTVRCLSAERVELDFDIELDFGYQAIEEAPEAVFELRRSGEGE